MHQDEVEGIAIIGLAGRFPGARNVTEFWANLREGVESVTFFTDEELAGTVNPAWLSNPNYVKANAVLEDADMFDGAFFGFNPRESEVMDPQHRVFLECAWEALESAGYDGEKYEGAVSVYGGVDLSSYLMNIFSNQELVASVGALQAIMSNDKDHLCTRVSHKLNLRGPSICVQSACSTSLTAVHVACRSLLNYECDMALAGGTSIKWPQLAGYMYEEAGINSPDGHCRAFDAQARGTLGGNGVGVVVLKRLADALADGDHVHAVIRGSAMNNDGSHKISYTAPSVDGQAEVIAMAHALAGVEPETITYVEAHGTATELGDTIEMAALTKAFRRGTEKVGYCGVGSVKTNIGHLDAAAGIAGLIKTVLALKHKTLPPSLHFTTPNPNIDFANSPFYVNASLAEWKADDHPRRAGVSSYGMGGTNVHVVLEEFEPDERPRPAARDRQILTLSARTRTALDRATANLAEYLREHPGADLADIAYTLQHGRRAFAHRRALVCRDIDDALAALEGADRGRLSEGVSAAGEKSVVMMFSGQGAQYAGMGQELYRAERVFRQEVDRCAGLLREPLGFDLREALYPEPGRKAEADRTLQQTSVTQPALFVVEYALARWFESLGVRPRAMIGHSVGEYVAACLAGVFTVEDGLRLVAARGRLMQQLPGGSMLAVTLAEEEAREWLGEGLALAAVNGPTLSVVSGPDDAVSELEERLTAREIGCRRLHTSHAFHSAMMEPILESFKELVAQTPLAAPRLPYLSNVTGTWVTEAEAQSPDYWARHLRQTVRFGQGAEELLRDPHHVMLEVGPGETLTSLVRRQGSRADAQRIIPTLPAPREAQPDAAASAFAALAKLWAAGVAVDWQALHEGTERRRVYLPTYPFERQRYWIDVARSASASARQRSTGKQADVADWFYAPVWKQTPPLRHPAGDAAPRGWLLVGEPGALSERMAQRLADSGQGVVTAAPGESFARVGESSYAINPQEAEDYHRLLSDLERRGLSPQVVLHFGGLARSEPAASRAELFRRAQEQGFYSLLNLAKALGRSGASDAVQLGVVTSEVHDVTGRDESVPEKATVLGLCKVIPQEYPHITCRHIDLEVDAAAPAPELIDQLLAEMDPASADLVVAYRGGRAARRWVQAFDAVRLGEPPRPTMLRERGVYLITGGLGGVGMILAEHFARAARARLVLVGRSPFPPKEEWPRWLAEHDEDDFVSGRIKKLQALEAAGGDVTVLSANVADGAAMRDVVAEVDRRFGALHGVVHGAGINGERSVRAISETGPTECGWHFEPKVFGLQTLEEVLRGRELDFCLLLSSLSAVLGGLGFAAYSAANVYMDAFVQQQARDGGPPWVTVDWDGWLLGDEGLAGGPGAALDELSMKPGEGAEAFERVLAAPYLRHVVVSTADLQQRMAQWLRPGAGAGEAAAADDLPAGALYPRPELSEAYVAPATATEQAIADTWRELLGIEQIGARDNFFELGGHSLLATQLVSRMRKLFNVDLPLRRFFETPTVADLAALVMESRAEQLDPDALAEMAEEIKNIPEDELRKLLESEKQSLAEEAQRPSA
ncbi:MAG TPA: SDR family NAD(P)-dependent oxidoreductase [Pyrinomonadaceae bacterium]|nr:SDR family NAD(P)-dependent oxidoreductase [Pyrinomonadaceae bacterium]